MNQTLDVDMNKLKKTITWKFRGFLAGLILSVLAIAAGAAAIHPGLAIMVLGSALGFFFHVNAKMLDETLRQLRQAEIMLQAFPKDQATDILKDYKPGGYH